jgi:amino acid transporter
MVAGFLCFEHSAKPSVILARKVIQMLSSALMILLMIVIIVGVAYIASLIVNRFLAPVDATIAQIANAVIAIVALIMIVLQIIKLVPSL